MRFIKKISPLSYHSLFVPSLDAITFLTWGALLFKYWLSGEIQLLIHPNYVGLVVATGGILLILGLIKLFQIYRDKTKKPEETVVQHITLFPVGWSTFFLLGTAILGLLIPPKVLGSDIALQRGIRETLPLTQTEPQAFRVSVQPQERSLIDWIKTINTYPEPDAYEGEKVKVRGFVIQKEKLPDNYFLVAQFVITCCAIDAYPVALPVKLADSQQGYPADTWLEIEGTMISANLVSIITDDQSHESKRQVVIRAEQVTEIPTPRNPYGS